MVLVVVACFNETWRVARGRGPAASSPYMDTVKVVTEEFVIWECTTSTNETLERVDRLQISRCGASFDPSGRIFLEEM